MSEPFDCWQCGVSLAGLTPPLSRTDECRACRTQLHVCRMCRFYDSSKAKHCAEPVADEIQDKTRANFCGYFEAVPGRFVPRPAAEDWSREAPPSASLCIGIVATMAIATPAS
ncbi:MAG TPA: hypothetical protein VMO26_20985 [Vicinamibacterales bacterium]|nr:hypothetical protein [Vicinamibacterales bacterium]